MECKQPKNIKNCPCTYKDCPRKGFCCLCIKYHLKRNELPACCFSEKVEKTYDRSMKKFVECHKCKNI